MNPPVTGKNLRSLMPALLNKRYFNYGGQGPLPIPSLQAIQNSWQRIQELGPFTNDVWPYVLAELNSTKKALANTCGVSINRIALTENVTSGCILPLLGLPFKPGQRLLISDSEHPGIVSACIELARRQQLEIDILPVQQLRKGVDEHKDVDILLVNELERKLKPSTKLVVISHLLWNTGQIIPIKNIAEILLAHPSRPYLLVDAAQSFGQIPVATAANNADIYAFTGHKWACGPEGLGGVAISQRVLEEGSPTLIGWRSLKNESIINLEQIDPFHSDGRRFEVATSCIPLLAGLRSSLELLDQEGEETSRLKRIQSLSYSLWSKLKALPEINCILQGPPPAGLVSFTIPHSKSPKRMVRLLGQEGIWIRDLENPICLRACVHVTSECSEVHSLARNIEKVLKRL